MNEQLFFFLGDLSIVTNMLVERITGQKIAGIPALRSVSIQVWPWHVSLK